MLALALAYALVRATASPSPAPAESKLRTHVYTRVYDATLLGSASSPAAQNQSSTAGMNAFAILHADYRLGSNGWFGGASYMYTTANPFVPQAAMNALPEIYAAYRGPRTTATIGNQFFSSPWADSHNVYGLPPSAFQGVDLQTSSNAWTIEVARILRFENRTSTAFSQNTLLTSFPPGTPGMPSNSFVPGLNAPNTDGFTYGRLSYAPKTERYAASSYVYDVANLLTMAWFSAGATLGPNGWRPYLKTQGGIETNAGASYLGKIRSSIFGFEAGVKPVRGVDVSAAFDLIPWHHDVVALPKGVSCSSWGATPAYQVTTLQTTFGYFLPQEAAQCSRNANGTANVYYGGWASPYSDSYTTDPLFTTALIEGSVDRRSPGNSAIVNATYTSPNSRFLVFTSYAWYDYSNEVASELTGEWDTVVRYRFSRVDDGAYKGFLIAYGYLQQQKSNVVYADGANFLGGTPRTRYSRLQIEYAL